MPSQSSQARAFKNWDLFSVPAALNFDRKGSAHGTFFGGLFSIVFGFTFVLHLVVLLLIWVRKQKYVIHENWDDLPTGNETSEFNAFGFDGLAVASLSLIVSSVASPMKLLTKQTDSMKVGLEDVEKYLNIKFINDKGTEVGLEACPDESMAFCASQEASDDYHLRLGTIGEATSFYFSLVIKPCSAESGEQGGEGEASSDESGVACADDLTDWIKDKVISVQMKTARPKFDKEYGLDNDEKGEYKNHLKEQTVEVAKLSLANTASSTTVTNIPMRLTTLEEVSEFGIPREQWSRPMLYKSDIEQLSIAPDAEDPIYHALNIFIPHDGMVKYEMHFHRTPFEIMAYLGGLYLFIYAFFSFFIKPFARHSFIVKAMKRLYYARTKNPEDFQLIERKGKQAQENHTNLRNMNAYEQEFLEPKYSSRLNPEERNQKNQPVFERQEVKDRIREEIRSHRRIVLSNGSIFSLFCCLDKKSPIGKLYSIGREKVENEMNIVSLLKRVRHMEAVMDNSLMKSDARKFMASHAPSNLIDLDSDRGIRHTEYTRPTTTEASGDAKDTIFYFTKDKNVNKLKYFEHEVDQDLNKGMLFKDQFIEKPNPDFVDGTFLVSHAYSHSGNQTEPIKVKPVVKKVYVEREKIIRVPMEVPKPEPVSKDEADPKLWRQAGVHYNSTLMWKGFMALVDYTDEQRKRQQQRSMSMFRRSRSAAKTLSPVHPAPQRKQQPPTESYDDEVDGELVAAEYGSEGQPNEFDPGEDEHFVQQDQTPNGQFHQEENHTYASPRPDDMDETENSIQVPKRSQIYREKPVMQDRPEKLERVTKPDPQPQRGRSNKKRRDDDSHLNSPVSPSDNGKGIIEGFIAGKFPPASDRKRSRKQLREQQSQRESMPQRQAFEQEEYNQGLQQDENSRGEAYDQEPRSRDYQGRDAMPSNDQQDYGSNRRSTTRRRGSRSSTRRFGSAVKK